MGRQEPYADKIYVNPPKTLTYVGDIDWASLKLRYEKFCRDQDFMDLDSLEYLCWVLTGKAGEYYALVIRRYPGITYREMMDQLEKRFGFRQFPQAAHLQFHQSRQKEDEKIEEWAESLSAGIILVLQWNECTSILGAVTTDEGW